MPSESSLERRAAECRGEGAVGGAASLSSTESHDTARDRDRSLADAEDDPSHRSEAEPSRDCSKTRPEDGDRRTCSRPSRRPDGSREGGAAGCCCCCASGGLGVGNIEDIA